ncbi:glutamine--fructose-6-phosphate transaminase [Maricaulis maris]|uniref:Glutamine--fructose-6-phosphate transaminase n=2 Tax=Maricaulis maris TaxID=74318 RepID=A0A495DFM5_9PROT|nr:SIS domain-containing protein [Maricaulis maris]RKR00336.1 glutamine--fructose-6-phosphate transaminase [Maricaulis maris]
MTSSRNWESGNSLSDLGMELSKQSDALPTRMHREAAESAATARRINSENRTLFREVGARLRERDPKLVMTNARGSSDHAGVFGKYLISTRLGLPVASGAPSVSSVYGAPMRLEQAIGLSISQSGRSPDIVRAGAAMREAGAFCLALVNEAGSPLGDTADITVPLLAGAETSVAATKSYIASLINLLWITAEWRQDDILIAALERLPDQLEDAWALDWTTPLAPLAFAENLFVVGRGVGLGVTNEAALKFKETCQIHAEAFSAAECSHGPLALLGPEFPVLIFSQSDDTRASVSALVERLSGMDVPVYLAGGEQEGTVALPTLDAHPMVQPVLMIQSFYRAVADIAISRGRNPDEPPALKKVTETV